MIIVLLLSILVPTSLGSLLDLSNEYEATEEEMEIVGPNDMFDSTINDLIVDYPSLRCSSAAELITFKREYSEFIADSAQLQEEVLSGFPSRYKVLPKKLMALLKFANEEFEQLPKKDKIYIQNPVGYMMHKLAVYYPLKINKARKAEFKERKLTKEQIKGEVAARQQAVFLTWYEKDDLVDVVMDWRERLDKYEL